MVIGLWKTAPLLREIPHKSMEKFILKVQVKASKNYREYLHEEFLHMYQMQSF